MKNTKLIIIVLVILLVGAVAYVIGHRQGAVMVGAQSASVISATASIQATTDSTGVGTAAGYKTGRLTCWFYGGTWKEFPGHNWDCAWLAGKSTVNSTK